MNINQTYVLKVFAHYNNVECMKRRLSTYLNQYLYKQVRTSYASQLSRPTKEGVKLHGIVCSKGI